MKKRVFSFVLALIMAISLIPVETVQAARPGSGGSGSGSGSSYGSNLGWEYANVSVNSNGGYALSDPTGSNHLGQYVSVSYSGSSGSWAEG